MATDQGKEIFEKKWDKYDNAWRNTEGWNKREEHLKRIVNYFEGKKIPYSCFSDSKKLCQELFNSKNDRNYIYYTIFKNIDLKHLKKEPDGLKYIGPL